MLTDAARAYLAAFDAYLHAHRNRRDDQFVSDLRRNALEHLVAQRIPDAAAFLATTNNAARGRNGGRA